MRGKFYAERIELGTMEGMKLSGLEILCKMKEN